jgi:hypothetical protein
MLLRHRHRHRLARGRAGSLRSIQEPQQRRHAESLANARVRLAPHRQKIDLPGNGKQFPVALLGGHPTKPLTA